MARPGLHLSVAVAAAALLAGCSLFSPGGEVGTSSSTSDGPLRALTGDGSTIGPAVKDGQQTKTWTFGTELCSEDQEAEIVIDEVRYDTVPDLPEWSPEEDVPSIGARLRWIPPPAEGEREILPIAAARGGPENLQGEISALGDEPHISITPCEVYDEHPTGKRTWPVSELLTVLTVGPEGGVARRTHVDYHVGDDEYSISWSWQVGLCGSAVPPGLGCGKG